GWVHAAVASFTILLRHHGSPPLVRIERTTPDRLVRARIILRLGKRPARLLGTTGVVMDAHRDDHHGHHGSRRSRRRKWHVSSPQRGEEDRPSLPCRFRLAVGLTGFAISTEPYTTQGTRHAFCSRMNWLAACVSASSNRSQPSWLVSARMRRTQRPCGKSPKKVSRSCRSWWNSPTM
ncbi:hypothetical protein CORC01_14178, partial [Colletotrichum orchidophilum]